MLALAALLGDSMGFFFGRLLGTSFVKPAYLAKANAFQTRFGSRAFMSARVNFEWARPHPGPDPACVKAITTDPGLETVFLNMSDAGVGLTLKKR